MTKTNWFICRICWQNLHEKFAKNDESFLYIYKAKIFPNMAIFRLRCQKKHYERHKLCIHVKWRSVEDVDLFLKPEWGVMNIENLKFDMNCGQVTDFSKLFQTRNHQSKLAVAALNGNICSNIKLTNTPEITACLYNLEWFKRQRKN